MPLEIGDRLARLRTWRGFSQEHLAERAGVSVDVVRRLEQGSRSSARLTTLEHLAAGLGVGLPRLLCDQASREDAEVGGTGLDRLRRVLTSPGALPGFADFSDDDADMPDLGALEAAAERVWTMYQAGEYQAVVVLLPDLVTDARHGVREFGGQGRVAALKVLTTACHASAGVAITFGREDLAFTAVERALGSAEQCGGRLYLAASANFLSWIYRRHGRLDEAEQVATRAAEQCEPAWLHASAEEVSVFGGLVVNAAGAAARAGHAARARDLSRVAWAAAGRVGGNRVDQWAVFGPGVAAMTEVNNAVEYGDLDEALRLISRIPSVTGVPATWRARYLLNVAHVDCEQRRPTAAAEALGLVRRLAPEWMRYHPQARGTVMRLLDRKGRPPATLVELAAHLSL